MCSQPRSRADARMLAYRLAAPVIDVGTPEGLALARARVSERH